MTPLQKTYGEALATLPIGTLLFVRLGDFWELFGDCAIVGAKALQITLTNRQGVPMAGVPYHSFHRYASRLGEAGHAVATCELKNGGLVEVKAFDPNS